MDVDSSIASDWDASDSDVDTNIGNKEKFVNQQNEKTNIQHSTNAKNTDKITDKEAKKRLKLEKAKIKRDKAMGGDIFGLDNVEESIDDDSDEDFQFIVKSSDKKKQNTANTINNKNASLDKLELKKLADLTSLLDKIEPSINESMVRSESWLIFMQRLLTIVMPKLSYQDTVTLTAKMNSYVDIKKVDNNLKTASSKKAAKHGFELKDAKEEYKYMYEEYSDSSSNEYDYNYDYK